MTEEIKKQTKNVSVCDFTKRIKGTDLTSKEIKYNSTGIHFDRVLCYISDTRYGISVWLVKEGKTHQIKTPEQLETFVKRLLKYAENKKSELQKIAEKKKPETKKPSAKKESKPKVETEQQTISE